MNTVQAHWPPRECDRVGFKLEYGALRDHMTVALKGLAVHPNAWWYGCRFACEKVCQLRVGLRRANGERLMSDDWTVTTGEWCPLPWLLPGALTDHKDVYLDVHLVRDSGLDHGSPPPFLAATVAYIELPQIHPMDRFLFIGADGHPVAHWNRFRKEFGTPDGGAGPVWQTIHTVIPPLRGLLENNWHNSDVFCIHGWDEHVPPRSV
jgi:hypothetical protein